jgi:hypothetical protein
MLSNYNAYKFRSASAEIWTFSVTRYQCYRAEILKRIVTRRYSSLARSTMFYFVSNLACSCAGGPTGVWALRTRGGAPPPESKGTPSQSIDLSVSPIHRRTTQTTIRNSSGTHCTYGSIRPFVIDSLLNWHCPLAGNVRLTPSAKVG